MTTGNPPVAMQFDDARQQRMAALLGMWAFLATEVLFFGGMFAGYTVYRYWYYETWAQASRHLDIIAGTINTAVLLSSSWTMALAVDAARAADRRKLERLLILTAALGTVFLAIKGYEYAHKAHEHLAPGASFQWTESGLAGPARLFFAFYFVMTGFHALHMVIGLGVMGVIWWQARHGRFSPGYYTPVENLGLYWHFVDIVWVFLFPLFYLIDRT